MRPSRLILAGLVMIPLPAMAALPPHYQRQNELGAIIRVATEELGVTHPIEAIEMQSPDVYLVRSGKCQLEARVVTVPDTDKGPGWVGPRNFSVETGPVVCGD